LPLAIFFIPSYDLSAREREEKETKRIELERIAQ
jgi:hypothetical protein